MAAEKTKKQPKIHKFHLASKEREYLTTNLSLLLRSAVPIGDALQSLSETGASSQFKKAIAQIQRDIDNGFSLHKALSRSGVVSSQTLALIQLGEQSGNLVENLAVAAKQEEKQHIFQAKVRSALLYPVFVLGLTTIVGIAVAWFLLPRLSETFAQLDVELPFISKVFINLGIFLKANGIWAVPAFLGALTLLGTLLFVLPQTKNLGRRLVFHIPGIKRLLYEIEVARFGYLLGTLLRAGLPVTQALQLLHEASNAPQYRMFYAWLKQNFEDGYSFRTSFSHNRRLSNKLIPPSVQQMVIAAERSGALPETLVSIGDIYEEKADITTKNLETILEPLLLVLVAFGVLLVAIAVIMPIYGLLGGLDGV
jgi:type II secretory pathway component PulF